MTIFISIGVDCGPAEVLRKKKIRLVAYPFDWTVTYKGVSEIIQTNFKHFLPKDNENININSGVLYLHAKFPEDTEKYERRISRFYKVLEDNNKINRQSKSRHTTQKNILKSIKHSKISPYKNDIIDNTESLYKPPETILFIRKGHGEHHHKEDFVTKYNGKIKNDIKDAEDLDKYLQHKYPHLKYEIHVFLVCKQCFQRHIKYTTNSRNIKIYNIINNYANPENNPYRITIPLDFEKIFSNIISKYMISYIAPGIAKYETKFTARLICEGNYGYTYDDTKYIENVLIKMGAKVSIIIWNQNIKMTHKYPEVDMQIFMDKLHLEYPQLQFIAKHTYLFINHVYLSNWDLQRLKDKSLSGLCKTDAGVLAMNKLGVETHFVGFGRSLELPFNNKILYRKIQGCVVHFGGDSVLSGTQVLLEAWKFYIDNNNNRFKWHHAHSPTLIVNIIDINKSQQAVLEYWKSLKPVKQSLPAHILRKWPQSLKVPDFEAVGSIFLCQEVLDTETNLFLSDIAMSFACPSMIENWGNAIDEGRQSGSVVLTIDAPPMNQMIDKSSGILVEAQDGPNIKQILPQRMYTDYFPVQTYKTTPKILGAGLQSVLSLNMEECKRLTENAYNKASLDTKLFIRTIQTLFQCHLKNKAVDIAYFSQLKQDKWVDTFLDHKENGYFVELGAGDGMYISNSLFFERNRKWNGICIEANPKYYEDLIKNRVCNTSNFCISDEDDKELDFAVCDDISGAIMSIKPFSKCHNIIKVKTKTLESVLKEYNAPKHIDYLSLDVDGHEYIVLKDFPFSKYIFNCITVAHNETLIGPKLRNQIRQLLEKNSYVFKQENDDVLNLGLGANDDYYVHSSYNK